MTTYHPVPGIPYDERTIVVDGETLVFQQAKVTEPAFLDIQRGELLALIERHCRRYRGAGRLVGTRGKASSDGRRHDTADAGQ